MKDAISLNNIRDNVCPKLGHDEQFNLTDLFLRAYLYHCMVTPLMKGQDPTRLE